MSRAFIKEDAGEGEDLPLRHPGSEPNYVTPRGLAQLRGKVKQLSDRLEALPPADRPGSPAARNLRYFEQRLDSAILIAPGAEAPAEVRFGVAVEVRYPDGSVAEFSIVGEDEAEPAQSRISWCSPLARALLGSRAGDKVPWRNLEGDIQLEIRAIRHQETDA